MSRQPEILGDGPIRAVNLPGNDVMFFCIYDDWKTEVFNWLSGERYLAMSEARIHLHKEHGAPLDAIKS